MAAKGKISVMFLLAAITLVFLFPREGLAVDYSITDVRIDAHLLPNGNVEVNETHTYNFDGEFNGITRMLVPKEGTSIGEFEAAENGENLRVEKEDDLYLVHRKGEDEQITVSLGYTIENGVDVYSDVAEFYWPFFDDRNESSYENLTVTILPPEETTDVLGFGYDEAFQTEMILSDGKVVFELGEVPAGENGDIRVAYDATLFPSASLTASKPMRTEIIKAQQDLLDEAAARVETQQTLSTIAKVGVPILAILLFGLMLLTYLRYKMKKAAVEREAADTFFVPEQVMSLPATIYFTNGASQSAEAMAAALMDLVRQGYVSQVSNTQFKINSHNEKGLKHHERMLISFLFYTVGKEGQFSFNDLSAYIKNKANHQTYHSNEVKWMQAVASEVKEKGLYEKNKGYRWTLAVISLLLLPVIILFATYDLIGWFLAGGVLFLTAIFYAIFYKPKTWIGLKIIHDWGLLKERFKGLTGEEWQGLSKDEQMRAYIYGIGIKNKGIVEKNEELVKSFQTPLKYQFKNTGAYTPADIAAFTYFGPLASSSFHNANQTSQSSISSSTSTSTGGGGVGGGGGGSGAF
ncbi:Uncharacterized membrane protein [Mesobacillus persicus]|uniref:Uncharacterized membrane protein n=1 Tax=Mesobacillus persicus TaxID=930146 RepID=A0A1H8G890_9BACI|nr:DUF2207 domain-containing protein [Mesobacillus persicus]SEN40079.1 Uncharacterized membrane protein [Mesobacillus persicus]